MSKQSDIRLRNVLVLEALKRFLVDFKIQEMYTSYDGESFIAFEDGTEVHVGITFDPEDLEKAIKHERARFAEEYKRNDA